jgi:hypothetical protein
LDALTPELRAFLDAQRVGVLATTAGNGLPRQSLTYYARDSERILISTLAQRLKTRDVQRTRWASICVMAHEPPYASSVFSGPAEILTENIGPPTAMVMQRIANLPEPPPAQTDEDLAAVGRVVLAISIEHVSAVNYVPNSGEEQ